jgi:hypothetical protein
MFMGYFIKYNPKEPMEDCGYIAVMSRLKCENIMSDSRLFGL